MGIPVLVNFLKHIICDVLLYSTVIIEVCVMFRCCNSIEYCSTIVFPVSLYVINIYFSRDTEVYSGFIQRSKMELFANIRNGLKPLAIFLNSSILDACLASKYPSEVCFF